MDFSKKRINAVLSFLFLCAFAQAQNWEVKASYVKTDSTETLDLHVMPDYSDSDTVLIDFSQSILAQNFKENVEVWQLVDGQIQKTSTEVPFTLVPEQGFSYQIDLAKSYHIPSKAYLNYGNIQVANWEEILFDGDADWQINLVLEKEEKRYELGVKSLSKWKSSPSKILPTKTLVKVNKIDLATNLNSKDLSSHLEEVLKPFKYLPEGKEVLLIFANDSLASGGITYPDFSIVYIDAKTSDSDPKFALQQTLLHELFHSVLPYEIKPASEAMAIGDNWIAEAAPEYFSLRFQLKNALITESVFITQLEQKMRISRQFDGKSLFDLSTEIYSNPANYNAFYTKGCIALFLADLNLFKEMKSAMNLLELILKEPSEFEDDKEIVMKTMLDFEQEIVLNPNPFNMNKYLGPYGWIYEKQVVLPYSKENEVAEIRKENILKNKMANTEQKSLWEGFISR